MENDIKELWIARDEDGSLYLYRFKPLRDKEGDEPGTFFPDPLKPCCTFDIIDYRMYPEVTWENSPQILAPKGAIWSDQNSPWRKYPDEKPPQQGDYLVCLKGGYIYIDSFIKKDKDPLGEVYDEYWLIENNEDKIIAWMPLPQPPKFLNHNNDNNYEDQNN